MRDAAESERVRARPVLPLLSFLRLGATCKSLGASSSSPAAGFLLLPAVRMAAKRKSVGSLPWLLKAAAAAAAGSQLPAAASSLGSERLAAAAVMVPHVPRAVASLLLAAGLPVSEAHVAAAARGRVPGAEAWLSNTTFPALFQASLGRPAILGSTLALQESLRAATPAHVADLMHVVINARAGARLMALLLQTAADQMKADAAQQQQPEQQPQPQQPQPQQEPPQQEPPQQEQPQQQQPQQHQPGSALYMFSATFVFELLCTALQRDKLIEASAILELMPSAQDLSAEQAVRLLLLFIQQPPPGRSSSSRASLVMAGLLTELPAAQDISAADAAELLCAAVTRRQSSSVASLCAHLPAAHWIGEEAALHLLESAVQHSTGVEELCDLDVLQELDGPQHWSTAERLLISAVHLAGLGYDHDDSGDDDDDDYINSGAIAAVEALCERLPIAAGVPARTVFEQLQLATERGLHPAVVASLTGWLLAEALDPVVLQHDDAVRAMTGAMFSGNLTTLHHWCRLVSQWPLQPQADCRASRAVAQLLQAGICCDSSEPLDVVVEQMAAHVRALPAALAADVLCLAIQVGQPEDVQLLAAQPWACLQGFYDTSSCSFVCRVLSAAVQCNNAAAIQLLHAQLVACGRALPAVTLLPAVHLAVQLRAQAALHALCALPAAQDLPGDSLRALHNEAVHARLSLGERAAPAAARAFHYAAAAGTLQLVQLQALHRAMCWRALGLSQAAPAADTNGTLFNALLGAETDELAYTTGAGNAAALEQLTPGGLMALLKAAITRQRRQLFVFVWKIAERKLSGNDVAELLLAAVSASIWFTGGCVRLVCEQLERNTRLRLLIHTQHVLPAAVAAAQLGRVVALTHLCRLPVKHDSGAEISMADALPQASLQHLQSIMAFGAGRGSRAGVVILGAKRSDDQRRGSVAAMYAAVAAGAAPGFVRRCRPQQLSAIEVVSLLVHVARTYGDASERQELLGIISDCCCNSATGEQLCYLTPEQLSLVTAEFENCDEDQEDDDNNDDVAAAVAEMLARFAAREKRWLQEGRQRLRRWLQDGRC